MEFPEAMKEFRSLAAWHGRLSGEIALTHTDGKEYASGYVTVSCQGGNEYRVTFEADPYAKRVVGDRSFTLNGDGKVVGGDSVEDGLARAIVMAVVRGDKPAASRKELEEFSMTRR